jgi:hypothetical protein
MSSRRVHGFWSGVMMFWLGFGVIYVVITHLIRQDTRIVNVTVGALLKLAALVAIWPLEVLGLDLHL